MDAIFFLKKVSSSCHEIDRPKPKPRITLERAERDKTLKSNQETKGQC